MRLFQSEFVASGGDPNAWNHHLFLPSLGSYYWVLDATQNAFKSKTYRSKTPQTNRSSLFTHQTISMRNKQKNKNRTRHASCSQNDKKIPPPEHNPQRRKSDHAFRYGGYHHGLTQLLTQSRFGDDPLYSQVVCPLNRTAALKGLRAPRGKPTTARA